ncbi:MAG: LysR family transcriptional regulator [Pseudomonadota bacterium]
MDHWFELRTIAAVARLGTVSAASRELQLHRATVQRHVDLMEESLGVRLFLRHARGYTATAAARDLAQVAERAQVEIERIAWTEQHDQGLVAGRVTITATSMIAQVFMPLLASRLSTSPGLSLRCLTGLGFEALEEGDVDIAIRVGHKPEIPEYVVQSLGEVRFGLFGSPDYVALHGHPSDISDLEGHIFAGPPSDGPRVGPYAWLLDNIPERHLRLRSDDAQVLNNLVLEGHALGPLPTRVAERAGMVDVIVKPGLWSAPLWVVTHRDVHRLARIQACLETIKAAAQDKDSMVHVPLEPMR